MAPASSPASRCLLRFVFLFIFIISFIIILLQFNAISPSSILGTTSNRKVTIGSKQPVSTTTTTTTVIKETPASSLTAPSSRVKTLARRIQSSWNRSIYLPVPAESVSAFKYYERKQILRIAGDAAFSLWKQDVKPNSKDEAACLAFTPECEFFRVIDTPVLFDKCCSEHRKLKEALTYTMRVAKKYKLQLFLDSGTLLSYARDGGNTLIPWETDIDLGIVGAWPEHVDESFRKFQQRKDITHRRWPHHYFESCKRKKSANKSRDGTCSDAFYVYFAKTAREAEHDTSRVEIWPFREDGALLVHPTRKKLTIHRDVVVPLKKCGEKPFWGISIRDDDDEDGSNDEDVSFVVSCPHKTEQYLDNEYGPTWKWPKTIHWGQNNAPAWNVKKEK